MIKFLSISSGSNGNCYYLGDDNSAILIDVGIGLKTIRQRLASCGIDIKSVEAILITHDHSDHIKGLGKVAKRLSVPVFATARLHESISRSKFAEECYPGCRRVIRPDKLYDHRGIKFYAFDVSHDATQTLGYRVEIDGVKILFMTDLGEIPQCAFDLCREVDYIVIESNYDHDMLMSGTYPPDLKLRIESSYGHLDNKVSAGFVASVFHKNLKGVFLCHISKENNTPDLAYDAMKSALAKYSGQLSEDFILKVLPRTEIFYTTL